jgi:hypothetical protein
VTAAKVNRSCATAMSSTGSSIMAEPPTAPTSRSPGPDGPAPRLIEYRRGRVAWAAVADASATLPAGPMSKPPTVKMSMPRGARVVSTPLLGGSWVASTSLPASRSYSSVSAGPEVGVGLPGTGFV